MIVPSATYIATWLSVSAAGATPVPVEVDEGTHLLDPALVEAAITPSTRAIMPVHLYGQPADLAALRRIADRHGLALVDDAAQAHGARHRGERIGGGTTATAFSFYPGKNLGALGDGGAVLTSDAEVADRLRLLRNYGSRRKYHHEIRATNSRLDEVQAALLRVKLGHLERWNARRARIADRYRAELMRPARCAAAGGGRLGRARVAPVRRPLRRPGRDAGEPHRGGDRHPDPLPRSGAPLAGVRGRRQVVEAGTYPLAESIADQVLSLPMGPHLRDEDVTQVIAAVRAAALIRTR